MKLVLKINVDHLNEGKLTPYAIAKAKPIMPVSRFDHRSPVFKELSSHGNITDWHKCSIEINTRFHVENLKHPLSGEIHVYKNTSSGNVYYKRDYKIKLNDTGNTTIQIDDLFKMTSKYKGPKL